MNNKIKNFIIKYKFIIILCVIGLLPLTWFKTSLIAGADEGHLLDVSKMLDSTAYAWNGKLNNGAPSLSVPNLFPMLTFWMFFKYIGLSIPIIERLWFIFLWIPAGLAIYYLITQLFKESPHKEIAGFIGALFYLFNIFTILQPTQSNFRLVYMITPLILTFWIKGLNEPENSNLYAILIGISTLIFASSSNNIPSIASIGIILILYFLFNLLFTKTIKDNCSFLLKTLILFLLFNSWWILTTFSTMIGLSSTFSSLPGAANIRSTDATILLNVFRLLGYWAWWGTYEGQPYVSFAHIYENLIINISTFIIPLIAFSTLLIKSDDKKTNRYAIFFGLLGLFGLFLAKGINQPLGSLYELAFYNIPGFWIFRDPWAKFTPIVVFAYSILIAIFTIHVYNYSCKISLTKPIRYSYLLFVSILIILTAFPMFTGEVILDWNQGTIRSLHVDVPDYWYDAADWLNEMGRAVLKLFILPKAQNGSLLWEHGYAGSATPAIALFDNRLVLYASFGYSGSYSDIIINKIYDMISSSQIKVLEKPLINESTSYLSSFAGKGTISLDPDIKIGNKSSVKYSGTSDSVDQFIVKYEPPYKIKMNNSDYLKLVFKSNNNTGWNRVVVIDGEGNEIKWEFDYPKVNEWKLLLFKINEKNNENVKFDSSNIKSILIIHYGTPETAGKSYSLYINELSVLSNIDDFRESNNNKYDSYININGQWHQNSDSEQTITKMLSLINVRYLVQQNDYNWKYGMVDTPSPEKMKEKLSFIPNISFVKSFGQLDIYELNNTIYLDQIYGVDDYVFTENIDSLFTLVSNDSFNPIKTAVFVENQLDKYKKGNLSKINTIDLNKPNITFKVLNPTEYAIQITNSTSPFFLIFSESYNPQWKLYISEVNKKTHWVEMLYSEPISEENHYIVNGYANAWYINDKGNYTITLFYKTQIIFYLGIFISLITLCLSIGYLFLIKKIFR